MKHLKRKLRRIAAGTRAGPALYRAYSWLLGLSPRQVLRNRAIRKTGAADGLPIPPDRLIFRVAATRDIEWFLRSGRAAARSIRGILADHNVVLADMGDVLDFGCGCGRVLRHWHDLDGPRVEGCDYNPRLVRWVAENLQFVEVSTNDLSPPLPYKDLRFDLVYALSVFTHLNEQLQQKWILELRRVIRPAGLLLISTHGIGHEQELTPLERERYDRGDLVVRNDPFVGTNMCTAYHPRDYVQEVLANGFEVAAFAPEGAAGNPRQDLYLLRKR